MEFNFFDLNAELEGLDSFLRYCFIFSRLIGSSDIFVSFFEIDGIIKRFATLENPFSISCEKFSYGKANLKFQVSVREYKFDNMEIPNGIFKSEIEKFINSSNKERAEVVIARRVLAPCDLTQDDIFDDLVNEPEKLMKVIKESSSDNEYRFEPDSFDNLSTRIIQIYYNLGLHNYTKYLPEKYLCLFSQSEIKNVSKRFFEKSTEVFLENPSLVRFLNFEDREDSRLFEGLCCVSPFNFCDVVYEFIKNGKIFFTSLVNMTFDEIKETKIYELEDLKGQNILFSTSKNPELSIKLISFFSVKYTNNKDGSSPFENLSKETIRTYYDLGLHTYTNLFPKEFFSLFVDDWNKIDSISELFANKEINFFSNNTGAIKFLTLENFSDESFFSQISNLTRLDYYAGMRSIDVAIYYRYEKLIKNIQFTEFTFESCEGWRKLSEETLLFLLMKGETNALNDPDTKTVLEFALEKSYLKLIDYIFERNNSLCFDVDEIPFKTYEHLVLKYLDCKGVHDFIKNFNLQ